MRVATITEAKNKLSALIDLVKEGQSVLILDRGIPVARLEPALSGDVDDDARLARLERKGLIRRGSAKVPGAILEKRPPPVERGWSAVDALLDERRTGR